MSYTDIKTLKNGIYGNVYKAKEIQSQYAVVIKEAKAELGQAELENELSWLKNVSHPKIVSIITLYDDSSRKVKGFVQKYEVGGSLQNLIYDHAYESMTKEFWRIVS